MAERILIESNLNNFFSNGCLITGEWGPILEEIALDIGFVTNLDESTGYLVTVSGYIGQADDINDYETYPRYISDSNDNLCISFSDLGWEVAYGPDLSYPYDSWIVENIHQEDFSNGAKISLIKIVPDTINEIGKIKLFNTLYNIKDITARQQISDLPKPMIFKGSLGTGGTISTLPSASIQTIGHTYKVITDGYYEGIQAKIGDMIVCNDTPEWILIPSGDDAGGTVTNVATGTGLTGGPITTSGTISVDFNSVQSKLVSGTDIKTINNTSLLGSGNINVQGVLTAGENIIIDANNEISVDMTPITNQYIDSLFS